MRQLQVKMEDGTWLTFSFTFIFMTQGNRVLVEFKDGSRHWYRKDEVKE